MPELFTTGNKGMKAVDMWGLPVAELCKVWAAGLMQPDQYICISRDPNRAEQPAEGNKENAKWDVIDACLDENGKFSQEKMLQNLRWVAVDQPLSSDFINSCIKNNIPILAMTYVEPAKDGEELAKSWTFIYFPVEEQQRVNLVINDFTQERTGQKPMSHAELLEWLKNNEHATIAATVEIDEKLYDYMERAGMLNIPRSELKRDDGVVTLAVPKSMAEAVLITAQTANAIYSANFKQMDQERESELRNAMERILTNAKNDLHNCAIVNAQSPSDYVRINKDGFAHYIETEAGPQLIEKAARNDRSFEQKLYNILHTYDEYKEFAGKDEEIERDLRDLQARGPQPRGITAAERVNALKQRELAEYVALACEIVGGTRTDRMQSIEPEKQGYLTHENLEKLNRLKDDIDRMKRQLDSLSAKGRGNSQEAGDLRGDLSQVQSKADALQTEMPKSQQTITEGTKDLSDARGNIVWDNYLSQLIDMNAAPDRPQSDQEKAELLSQFKEMTELLAKETPEVQIAFLKEMHDTICEVLEQEERTIIYKQTNGLDVETREVDMEKYVNTRTNDVVDRSTRTI